MGNRQFANGNCPKDSFRKILLLCQFVKMFNVLPIAIEINVQLSTLRVKGKQLNENN